MIATFADPTEWWFEISDPTRTAAWQQSRNHCTPASQWTALLNQLCRDTLLPWFQSELERATTPWLTEEDQQASWGLVNGTLLRLGQTRVLLVPSESIDGAELEVPQEWIDLPTWVPDYLLAVQVQANSGPDPSWLRVWGYTTHQDMKTQGYYDPGDRTYRLDASALTRDLGVFRVTLDYCPDAETQGVVAALPPLGATQADSLLQRLAQPTVRVPRLALPFPQWGALLEQPSLRRSLHRRRLGQVDPPPRLNSLGAWLQQQVAQGWQTLDQIMGQGGAPLAWSYRSEAGTDSALVRAKALQVGAVAVVLVVRLEEVEEGRVAVIAQVHPGPGQPQVPPGLSIALRSDSGEVLQTTQATDQDDYIQLRRFRCPGGTAFSFEIRLAGEAVIEPFVA